MQAIPALVKQFVELAESGHDFANQEAIFACSSELASLITAAIQDDVDNLEVFFGGGSLRCNVFAHRDFRSVLKDISVQQEHPTESRLLSLCSSVKELDKIVARKLADMLAQPDGPGLMPWSWSTGMDAAEICRSLCWLGVDGARASEPHLKKVASMISILDYSGCSDSVIPAIHLLTHVGEAARGHADAVAKMLTCNRPVREAAALCLVNMGVEGGNAAAKVLDAKQYMARKTALEILARLGASASHHADAVAELKEDDMDDIKKAAAECLDRIGGLQIISVHVRAITENSALVSCVNLAGEEILLIEAEEPHVLTVASIRLQLKSNLGKHGVALVLANGRQLAKADNCASISDILKMQRVVKAADTCKGKGKGKAPPPPVPMGGKGCKR